MSSLTLALTVLVALAAACSGQQFAARYPSILRYSNDQTTDGSFQYGFQTEDGISSEVRGGPLARSINGQYSYTGPDRQVYTITYVADENGYRASGAHLPQPHPIPAAIQRSIDFNLRNNPESFRV